MRPRLQWTALGLKVPVTINEVELFVQPLIDADERGPRLVFRPVLEKADFKHLPGFVDQAIAKRINAALKAEGDLLAWHMGETLNLSVPLPTNLTPVSAFELEAGATLVETKADALGLYLEAVMRFSRRRKDVADAPPEPENESPG